MMSLACQAALDQWVAHARAEARPLSHPLDRLLLMSLVLLIVLGDDVQMSLALLSGSTASMVCEQRCQLYANFVAEVLVAAGAFLWLLGTALMNMVIAGPLGSNV